MEKILHRHRLIFTGDTLLNWVLGFWLLLGNPDAALMQSPPVLVPLIYRIVGAGFIAFAFWQTLQLKNPARPGTLFFAFWMAVLPIVLLGFALIYLHAELKPVARIVLWLGEFYMLVLSGWYSRVRRKVLQANNA